MSDIQTPETPLGRNVRLLLELRRLNQQSAAERLDMNTSTLSRKLNGNTRISRLERTELANVVDFPERVFDLDPEELEAAIVTAIENLLSSLPPDSDSCWDVEVDLVELADGEDVLVCTAHAGHVEVTASGAFASPGVVPLAELAA